MSELFAGLRRAVFALGAAVTLGLAAPVLLAVALYPQASFGNAWRALGDWELVLAVFFGATVFATCLWRMSQGSSAAKEMERFQDAGSEAALQGGVNQRHSSQIDPE